MGTEQVPAGNRFLYLMTILFSPLLMSYLVVLWWNVVLEEKVQYINNQQSSINPSINNSLRKKIQKSRVESESSAKG